MARTLGCTSILLTVVSFLLSDPVFAQKRYVAPAGMSGRTLDSSDTPRELPDVVEVIVQFREPAGARTRTTAAYMEPERLSDRGVAVLARAADLRRDLERLDAAASGTVRTESEPVRVAQTFSRVLFGASARVRLEMLPAIEALPYVASVHVARSFRTTLANSVPHIRANQVWSTHGTRGAGVVVAVIDSGIDYHHPAFGGGIGAGFKVAGGWDFTNDDSDPVDDNGHGTHVAGIIGANGGGLTGVAPEVTLLAFKAFDQYGQGEEGDILAAIERSVDPDQDGDPSDHVDVVNISAGAPAVDNDPVAQAVENATAAGILFCISAGNSGAYGNIGSPAIASSVIAVGASDLNDNIAGFSSRGPSYDFGIKPEVVAPGVEIVSSVLDGKTQAISGTSMAAPHVAGVAALLKSLHEEWSPAELKSAIVTTSVPLQGDVMATGAGRVDALRASAAGTFVQPTVVSFGQVSTAVELWSTSRTFTLRNITGAPQTLTAAVSGLRDGVAVRVTPDSVTLAPGESQTVTAELTVTNSAVPIPYEGSLSFGGRITWKGGAVPIHLPWAFVKGGFITVEVTGNQNYMWAQILSSRMTFGTDFFYSTARFFWPLEKVDLVVAERPVHAPLRVAFAEELDLESGAHALIDMRQANHVFMLEATDDTGSSLRQPGRGCADEITFSFPTGAKASFEQGSGDGQVKFGSVSSRATAYLATRCSDDARGALFMTMHEPQQGLAGNVLRLTRPHWLRQDVRFVPAVEPPHGLTVAITLMHFPGTPYHGGGGMHLMRGTGSELTLFYTASPVPEVRAFSILERYGECPDGGDCPLVDSMFVYLDEDRVTAQGEAYTELSPMGYQVAPGEPLTFGDVPVWPYVAFDAIPGAWAAGAVWRGPLSERRTPDTINARTAVYDAAGKLIREGPAGAWGGETLPAGLYRIESINAGYAIAGLPGTATFTGWADTRKRQRDSLLPSFAGLRVVDENDRAVVRVDRQGRASLLFSVADYRRDAVLPQLQVVPPREEATLVEYRSHGTSDWRPLPALVVARHYKNNQYLHGGTGTMYRADLTAVIQELGGAIDLRIRMEDEEGNSGELRLEPAFFSGTSIGRRRSVGH